MIELRLFESQLDDHQQWRLVEWCRMRGADEFSLRVLWAGEFDAEGNEIPTPDVDPDTLLAPLGAFARSPAVRELPVLYEEEALTTDVPLWSLTEASLTALRRLFPRGPLARPDLRAAMWPEDFAIYRGGVLLLGFITHEGEAVLRVTALEHDALVSAGLVRRPP